MIWTLLYTLEICDRIMKAFNFKAPYKLILSEKSSEWNICVKFSGSYILVEQKCAKLIKIGLGNCKIYEEITVICCKNNTLFLKCSHFTVKSKIKTFLSWF